MRLSTIFQWKMIQFYFLNLSGQYFLLLAKLTSLHKSKLCCLESSSQPLSHWPSSAFVAFVSFHVTIAFIWAPKCLLFYAELSCSRVVAVQAKHGGNEQVALERLNRLTSQWQLFIFSTLVSDAFEKKRCSFDVFCCLPKIIVQKWDNLVERNYLWFCLN